MKKLLLFSILCFAVSAFTFADGLVDTPKPWILATACNGETQYHQAAYYFDTEEEATAFANSWCSSNYLPKKVETTITAPAVIGDPVITTDPTIFSFPVIPTIPPKPWIVATACDGQTQYQGAFYFDTEEEARAFADSWCANNNEGGCNCSLYHWVMIFWPYVYIGADLICSWNCMTGTVTIDGRPGPR